MNIGDINKKFCAKKFLDKSIASFYSAVDNETHLLRELGVEEKREVFLVHKETALILKSPTGFSTNVVRYRLDIQILGNINKGYYDYIIDLEGNPVDDFLVIK